MTQCPVFFPSSTSSTAFLCLYRQAIYLIINESESETSIYAFDARTGEQVWKYSAGYIDPDFMYVGNFPSGDIDYIADVVALTESRLYYLNHYGRLPYGSWLKLCALDIPTQKVLWTSVLAEKAIFGWASLTEHEIYLRKMDGDLSVCDIETGEQLWMFNPLTEDEKDNSANFAAASSCVLDGIVLVPAGKTLYALEQAEESQL